MVLLLIGNRFIYMKFTIYHVIIDLIRLNSIQFLGILYLFNFLLYINNIFIKKKKTYFDLYKNFFSLSWVNHQKHHVKQHKFIKKKEKFTLVRYIV